MVAPTDLIVSLEAGSHLEAIPTGSIGHLLTSSSKYFPNAPNSLNHGGVGGAQEFVKIDSKNGSPFAIVVRFTKDAEYLRRYGSVALNMALAQLYREAQLTFDSVKAIEVLDRGTICLVGSKEKYDEAVVESFVDKIASELTELGVVVGVFCDVDREASGGDGLSKLDSINSVEFARFAASDYGRSGDNRVRHFSYSVAISILQALRESRSFKIAYADFQRLRKLGVESAGFLNIGGLVAGGLGLHQEALELYAAAVAKDPVKIIYKSNYGTAAYQAGEIDAALKLLNNLPLTDIDKLKKLHPFGYVGYARLLARARLSGSAMFNTERFAHVAEEALNIQEYAASPILEVIREAMQMPG